MFWKRMFGDKPAPEQAKESGFFKKLVSGLEKTKQNLVSKVEQITSGRRVDESLFEELEEVLIEADCGVATAMFLVDQLRERAREEKITEAEELRRVLQEEMVALLEKNAAPLKTPAEKPYVIMVVGVNGAGKTTTIAKLAYRFQQENAKVLLAAGDTFRAGAIEQLGVWANRLGVELIAHQEGSDPAAVAYDAINAAKARDSDVLIIDTAGRLQTKVNLMSELSKIHRVVKGNSAATWTRCCWWLMPPRAKTLCPRGKSSRRLFPSAALPSPNLTAPPKAALSWPWPVNWSWR